MGFTEETVPLWRFNLLAGQLRDALHTADYLRMLPQPSDTDREQYRKARDAVLRTLDSIQAGQPAAPVADEHENDAAVAAIKYALAHGVDGMDFLHCWSEGDFQAIREEWSDAPESVFIGADPLHPKTRAALQQAQSAQQVSEAYFAYDADNGFHFFDTADEAKDYAQETLKALRKEAFANGEWFDEVEEIRWGALLGQIEEIELPDDGYDGSQGVAGYSKPVDYKLVDCAQPAQPAAVPVDEQEPAAYLHRMEKTTELSFWGEDAECTGRKDWIGFAPLFLHRDKGYLASFAQQYSVPEGWESELLDWVSACQSAYHIDSTPGHRFGGLGSNLEENRQGVVDFVRDLLAAAPQPKENGHAE